jgi:hypothetical protein
MRHQQLAGEFSLIARQVLLTKVSESDSIDGRSLILEMQQSPQLETRV